MKAQRLLISSIKCDIWVHQTKLTNWNRPREWCLISLALTLRFEPRKPARPWHQQRPESASTSLSACIFHSRVYNPCSHLQRLRDLKRKPCNFLWFNKVIYIWGIYILIMSSVPQRSHWLTLSLDDILWTHHEWMQMTGTGPAPWTFAGLN